MTRFCQLFLVFLFSFSLQNCDPSPETQAAAKSDTSVVSDQEEDGPPFKEECKASFDVLGEYKISSDNYNIYYSGKGWNSGFRACTWIWGEIVNNEFPEDTTVTFFKIHLLDLDKFSLPTDGSEYGHDSIKKYVIATYSRNLNGGKEKFSYDPFKTGKYPAPK